MSVREPIAIPNPEEEDTFAEVSAYGDGRGRRVVVVVEWYCGETRRYFSSDIKQIIADLEAMKGPGWYFLAGDDIWLRVSGRYLYVTDTYQDVHDDDWKNKMRSERVSWQRLKVAIAKVLDESMA